MNAELLRGWLDLKDAAWPPAPHVLLGIGKAERNLAHIETQVHARLETLRRYQISHPDEATEGMNRLAQAFVQIMEGYPKPTPADEAPVSTSPPANSDVDTAIERKTKLDWQSAPPPVRRSGAMPTIPPGNGKKSVPKAQPAPHVHDTQAMIKHLAHDSKAARAGLATIPAVVRRASETRRVLRAWNDAGRWLNVPKRRIQKPADDHDLARRLDAVKAALDDFVPILGQPGSPGYRVAATVRSPLNSFLVRGMDLPHRELLALDWVNGRNVLLMYRRFLLEKIKALRHRDPVYQLGHAIRWFVNDHPRIIGAVAVALVGVVSAIWLLWD